MAFGKQTRENVASQDARKALDRVPASDGLTHVMLFRSFGQAFHGSVGGADTKYNDQVNQVLVELQQAGLAILNVQTVPVPNQGVMGGDRYDTLITYR
ncbi:MAG: hypothetical protein PHR15_06460 [Atopobiaceae bacterium]|nr:hypothetical protein [Atopobiaceae bacterium]MCH4180704.1 hypothetical protein [Atopobiaceae bacterium]MCH4214721.1 hypothetical protein [Atopobiaceae bacterium]MCH4276767.1 hypothetical protein [Atopobiaceae bacterium]MCI1226585.1 hypothetical protein [Atopobiaceae bacterium]